MLTLLVIVYVVGLLAILLVAHLKDQRINFGHIILFILLTGMVFSFICCVLSMYNIRGSHLVTKIPNSKYDTYYNIRYDYKDNRYFVLAEDLFDISKAQYRIYLDNDAVESYIENANDFTKYIEECILDDN